MADKEERILIARSSHYIISNTDNETLFEGKIEPPYANAMTRQEAIEVMAKAIRSWEFPYSPRQIGWEDLSEDTKDDYKNMAEAALNAILEGGK